MKGLGEMEEKKDDIIGKYQYVVIPGNILNDPSTKGNVKIFYAVLLALSSKTGFCFASNRKLASIMSGMLGKIEIRQINNYISQLVKLNFIRVSISNYNVRKIYPIELDFQNMQKNLSADKFEKLSKIFEYDWLNQEDKN